jgi:predicted PilT family ATPase
MPVVTVFDSPRRTDGDRLIADVELAGVAELIGVRPEASSSLMTARS